MPKSAFSSRSRSRICAWIVTSSAVVGSSAISSTGSLENPIASITRWRMPPENWCGYESTARFGALIPMRPSRSTARASAALGVNRPCSTIVSTSCLAILSTGLSDVIGSWNTIATSPPRNLRSAPPSSVRMSRPRKSMSARHDASGLLDQPDDRFGGDALARAGLADDAERLAGMDMKRDAVDGADDALVGEEMRAQILDRQNRNCSALASIMASVSRTSGSFICGAHGDRANRGCRRRRS